MIEESEYEWIKCEAKWIDGVGCHAIGDCCHSLWWWWKFGYYVRFYGESHDCRCRNRIEWSR
jgi:hypothetical protein